MDDSDSKDVVVLGAQLAAAQAREDARLARGDAAPSPMPAEAYDDAGLLHVAALPLDGELRALTERFAAAGESERASVPHSLSMDDLYTLIVFAQRCAVFALRARDASWIATGARAIEMIDVDRIDWRDATIPAALLHHAARRLGVDARALGVLSEAPDDLADSCGLEEIETAEGIGFIGRGFEPYEPSRDLARIAIALEKVVEAGGYRDASVSIAEELPDHWLAKGPEPEVTGVATVNAHLPGDAMIVLMLFLAELEDPAEARKTADRARKRQPRDWGVCAVAAGELVCILIGRAVQEGTPKHESDATMARFAGPVAAALA